MVIGAVVPDVLREQHFLLLVPGRYLPRRQVPVLVALYGGFYVVLRGVRRVVGHFVLG